MRKKDSTTYSTCKLIIVLFTCIDSLQFNWHAVPEREKKRHKNSAEPVWSPTMAGGLFAIDRLFFERLGTYDNGFDIWGGENLELSFKTWMCGVSELSLSLLKVSVEFRKITKVYEYQICRKSVTVIHS
ncbi:hypothetical protein PV327_008773 [Microctonus hyperodae]|uniref:Galactosyltransferase C-terminal domain-containing protein n=1 Tax=Microctonus hyperodae TaxID=165561 RepID=A0AA39KVA5_MICHY|nr:hypothetical protein PV327_008773 [Microctonus hyperodae]